MGQSPSLSPKPTPSASAVPAGHRTYFFKHVAGSGSYRVADFRAPGDHFYVRTHCGGPRGTFTFVTVGGKFPDVSNDCTKLQDVYATAWIEVGAAQRFVLKTNGLAPGSWIDMFYQDHVDTYRYGTRTPVTPAATGA